MHTVSASVLYDSVLRVFSIVSLHTISAESHDLLLVFLRPVGLVLSAM